MARVLLYSFRDRLRPVTTGFLRFFAVLVRSPWILKLSGTGPVRGPSKKGNRTETGPDFKALLKMSKKGGHPVDEFVHTHFTPIGEKTASK